MEYKDYYKILEVPEGAPQEAVKKAYRRLARRFHPDFNKGNKEAENRFKEVNEAYQVLGDPEKRRKYDQLGANWDRYQNTQESPFDFSSFTSSGFQDAAGGRSPGFSDFFKTFFGGFGTAGEPAAGPHRARRPRTEGPSGRSADVTTQVSISVQEAVRGTTKRLTLNREEACPKCGGRGSISGAICPTCFGKGVSIRPEELEVHIPAGVRTGSSVRVRGKGHAQGSATNRGHLYLEVKVEDDPTFHLEGRDIHSELPVSLYEALLGAEVEVPIATGKVRMRIPAESQNGQIFRLKGKGLPAVGQTPAGDQIVRLRVVLPRQLTEREKELFAQLAKLRQDNPRQGSGA